MVGDEAVGGGARDGDEGVELLSTVEGLPGHATAAEEEGEEAWIGP